MLKFTHSPLHPWLRAGLLIAMAAGLDACSWRLPDAPEPLDLIQSINVAQPDQAVRFEFETSERNFYPGRPYQLEFEVDRRGSDPEGGPDMFALHIPFEVSLQRWSAGTWQAVPTSDSYQGRARNLGEPMPEWHRSSAWRYARLSYMTAGEHSWYIVTLPIENDARYRLDVRTVEPIEELQSHSPRLRVRADPMPGK